MGLLLGEKGGAYTITIGSIIYTIKGWDQPGTAPLDVRNNLEKEQTLLGWKKTSENPGALERSYEIVVVDKNGAVKWRSLDIKLGEKEKELKPKITWTELGEMKVGIPGVTAGPNQPVNVTYTQKEGTVNLNAQLLDDKKFRITIGEGQFSALFDLSTVQPPIPTPTTTQKEKKGEN